MIIPGVGAFNGGWLYKLGNCGHSIESASIFGRDDLEIGARCLAVCARCSAVSAWCSAGGARCSAVRARCSAIGARCSAVGARCSEVSARIQFSMFDFCAPTWDSGYKLGEHVRLSVFEVRFQALRVRLSGIEVRLWAREVRLPYFSSIYYLSKLSLIVVSNEWWY